MPVSKKPRHKRRGQIRRKPKTTEQGRDYGFGLLALVADPQSPLHQMRMYEKGKQHPKNPRP